MNNLTKKLPPQSAEPSLESRAATQQNYLFAIEGVKCGKCVAKLESLQPDGFASISAEFDKPSQTLTVASSLTPLELKTLIENQGFKAFLLDGGLNPQQEEEKKINRAHLTRLAVTGFLASNIMLFSASLYTGASDHWFTLFSWLSGVFFVPVFFYSAWPFYKNAWLSLKQRSFSADLAVAIAFFWGGLLSGTNLVMGKDQFYFDSASSFLFIILLARYVLWRMQIKLDSDINPQLLFKKQNFFQVLKAADFSSDPVQLNAHPLPDWLESKTLKEIKKNDILFLKAGELLPVDGELLSEKATMDKSFYSGEALPLSVFQGHKLKAGVVFISPAWVKAGSSFISSNLAQIFSEIKKNLQEKNRFTQKADVYAKILLTSVSLLSLALFVFFLLKGQAVEGFHRALALFTIACPCALAFSIPLAATRSLEQMARHGLLVKSPRFFEKLQGLGHVVFDKTGTLTLPLVTQMETSRDLTEHEQSILLSLEMDSPHLLAEQTKAELQARGIKPQTAYNKTEIPGSGVMAKFLPERHGLHPQSKDDTKKDELWEIKPLSDKEQKLGYGVYRNNELSYHVFFQEKLRPEAPFVLAKLQSLGLNVVVASGDQRANTLRTLKPLGLPEKSIYAPLLPTEKRDLVQGLSQALMVGDGHNDALAMSQSAASLAILGSVETSLKAADCYARAEGLGSVLLALDGKEFYFSLVNQNLFLSLFYNLIAGSLAALGYVNPLVAAILMPVNSLFVISLTSFRKPKLKLYGEYLLKKQKNKPQAEQALPAAALSLSSGASL